MAMGLSLSGLPQRSIRSSGLIAVTTCATRALSPTATFADTFAKAPTQTYAAIAPRNTPTAILQMDMNPPRAERVVPVAQQVKSRSAIGVTALLLSRRGGRDRVVLCSETQYASPDRRRNSMCGAHQDRECRPWQ